MNKPESTTDLATSVSQGLKRLETSAKSHPHHRITNILIRRLIPIKANFKIAFSASSIGTSAARGGFLPIIYEGDCIPSEPLTENDIEVKLGQYYRKFRASLKDARISLDGIIAISEELAEDNEGRHPTPGNPLGLGSVRGQTDTEVVNPAPKSPRLARGPQTQRLQRLLGELREHINDATIFQKLAPGYREQQEGNLWISWLPSLLAIPVVAVLSFFTSLIARRNNKQSELETLTTPTISCPPAPVLTHRTTLIDLYTVLSHKLKCRCHFVHLCLYSAPVSSSKSGLSSCGSENLGSICSLFITLDLSIFMDSYISEDPLYLKVLRHSSSNGSATSPISTPPQSPTRAPTSCSTIITSPVGSKHCLQCEPPARTEFLVKSTRPPARSPPANTPSSSPTHNPILTLRDILTSHSQDGNTIKLRDEDRLLLAAKFVGWITQYYDTPWLHGLDTHKICFFTRHENDPNYANWTPYISASFTRTSPERRKYNDELRTLGSVLLQLGLDKVPDYFPDNDWAQIIKIASHDLPRTLGKGYMHIVKKLLTEGARGDRMEWERICDLESETISIIQKTLGFLSE